MATVQQTLHDTLLGAVVDSLGPDYAETDPLVRPSTNPDFGDYQANLAMGLAKRLKRKPREIAEPIAERLRGQPLFERVEVAGPGFINLTLSRAFLEREILDFATDNRLGVPVAELAQTVVVDYSSPNVAKEMHVGHLRSTVIGDALVRLFGYLGHKVIRQNHLGDWGTQFGMLIEDLIDNGAEAGQAYSVSDLDGLYRQAKRRFDEDSDFAARARQRVVKLQAGDPLTLDLWRQLVAESERHFEQVYQRLGALLTGDDTCGESFYNDRLTEVVADLDKAGLLKESQGAAVVYPPGFKDRDGNPMPMIVRKSDGGYLYATTDFAAARYRIGDLDADRILIVTDARQRDHFAMLFAALNEAGWADGVRLDHVAFGSVLGPDRKPFKTRAGGTIKLVDLLDEAHQRARQTIDDKNPDLPDDERELIAEAVGIGALKYADLSNDRIKDYVFDWNRMLALDGNTAPYLLNAYVRIQSIFRRAGLDAATSGDSAIRLDDPGEKALALQLLQFPQAVMLVAETLEPHRLCHYLYELAGAFHTFYEHCPVLGADDTAVRDSRLRLCQAVATTLATGLGLLGIGVVTRM